MANKQLFVNNFESTFIANVKSAAETGTPATELDYGILRLNTGAAAYLTNPTAGDYYLLTAYKRSGSVESNVEILKVTAIDNSIINECRITVLRAQEGTSAQAYVPGDYISLRFTKGGADNFVQQADIGAAVQAYDGDLAAIAALSTNGIPKRTAANTWAIATAGTDYLSPADIGTAVQAYDGDLASIAGIAATDGILKKTAANTWSMATAGTDYIAPPTGTALLKANNGGALANAVAGTDYVVPSALTSYAPLASPALSGTPTAPTAAADTNTTQVATTAYVVGQASSASPAMDGSATVGTSLRYARADHVHPTDTSRAPLASPTFTGTPAAPTAATNTNTTQLATTAFVLGQGNSTAGTIAMNGTQAAGSSNLYARADHVHPVDTSRAPLASPTFTGTPAAPTAAVDTNTTQLATTAYVVGQGYLKSATASSTYAPLASPALTGTPTAPTAAVDTNTTQLATTAYVVGQGYLKSATAASTYLALTGGTLTGNLTFSGTSRRIVGDFNNATQTNRTLFQGSVTNGNTQVGAIPNGSSTQAAYIVHNNSDPTNTSTAALSINSAEAAISSAINGSGTYLPLIVQTGGANRLTFNVLGGADFATGLREARVAMGANDIDVRSGNYFTKTISGATTLTVSNVPAAGTAASFILDLTNGGSATITWWSGVKWAGGTAPTLTAAGRDVLGFFTHDGGTTWTGLLLGKDVK